MKLQRSAPIQPMRHLNTWAIVVMAVSCALLISARNASAQLIVTGGTIRERQEINYLETRVLLNVIIPRSPVALNIVTHQKMLEILHNGAGHDNRSAAAPDGTPDDDTDIDGIYNDGRGGDSKPSITLLTGEEISEFDHTFVHEYGHHVWSSFMSKGDHDTFGRLYAKQLAANQLVSDYASDSAEEDFAEAFAFYMIEPKTLRKRDPLSYRFMETLVGDLKTANEMSGERVTDAR